MNPYSLRLRIGNWARGVGSKALGYDPETKVLTFDPGKTQPAGLIFADGEKVEVELTAADYAGHSLAEPVKWSYTARSPLAVTPANPDGENGWYVTPPKIEMKAPEGSKVEYEWEFTPAQDEFFRKGNSVNSLTITVTDAAGKQRKYWKPFRLDRTVPQVAARREGGGRIVLEHDDYALDRGGLNCECFASGDLSGVPVTTEAKSAPGSLRLDPETARKVRSARWSGRLFPPAAAVYDIRVRAGAGQSAELAIDGEVVLDTAKAKGSRREVSREVLLRRKMHKVELRWRAEKAGVKPSFDLLWKSDAMPRQTGVPGKCLFAVRSLAKILCRWDDGDEFEYTGPIEVPVGRRTLSFYAVDEAGHRSRAESISASVE